MDNHIEGAVGGTVGGQGSVQGVSEAKKKWGTPELRKFQIAEVTAANPTMGKNDGDLGSS